MFTQVSVSLSTGMVPHLHFIILPLVPCPFWEVPHLHPIILLLVTCLFQVWDTSVTGPRSLLTGVYSRMGYPPARGCHPPARTGWGTLCSELDGVPAWPGQDGMMGYPPPTPSQDWMGYPAPTSQWDPLCLDRLCCRWYACSGFPHEDFLVI